MGEWLVRFACSLPLPAAAREGKQFQILSLWCGGTESTTRGQVSARHWACLERRKAMGHNNTIGDERYLMEKVSLNRGTGIAWIRIIEEALHQNWVTSVLTHLAGWGSLTRGMGA